MEQEPVFGYEKNLPKPELGLDKDDSSKKKEKKKKTADVAGRVVGSKLEAATDTPTPPKVKRVGESLLRVAAEKDDIVTEERDTDQQVEKKRTETEPMIADVDARDSVNGEVSPVSPELQDQLPELDSEGKLEDDDEVVLSAATSSSQRPQKGAPRRSTTASASTGNTPPQRPNVPLVTPNVAGNNANIPPPPNRNLPPQNPNLPPPPPGNFGGNLPPPPPPPFARVGNVPNIPPPPNRNLPPQNPNVITPADLHRAEKRGVRKGVLAGGLAGWWLTRRSRMKKAEKLESTLTREIDSRDERIRALEAQRLRKASEIAPKTVTEQSERHIPSREASEPVMSRILPVESRMTVEKAPDSDKEKTPRLEHAVESRLARKAILESATSIELDTIQKKTNNTERKESVIQTPEMEKKYTEDSFEKQDRTRDDGVQTSGAHPAAQEQQNVGHATSNSSQPANPIAQSVTAARNQAQKSAKQAAVRARIELAIGLGIALLVVIIVLFRALK